MITIHLNTEVCRLEKNLSLAEFLLKKNLIAESYAIALNRRFIPRTKHTTTILNDGDQIELITPMQGG